MFCCAIILGCRIYRAGHWWVLHHPDYNPVLDKLGTDFRFIHIRPPENYIANSMIGEFKEFVDEWGSRTVGFRYYDLHGAPLGKDLSIEKIDKYPWPDPYDPGPFVGVKEEIGIFITIQIMQLSLTARAYGNLWEMTRALVGMENALLLTIADTHIFDHLLGKLAEVLDGFYDAFLSVVGPYVQIVEMADDYGTNAGPMFNPAVYTKFFKPRYKKSIELIKKKAPQAKVMLHNDGAIRKFIPDLIETALIFSIQSKGTCVEWTQLN